MPDWKGAVKGAKGRAEGLVGRGNKSSTSSSNERNTMPIQSLRDPNSFAPPPKHTGYHGNPGSPPAIAPSRSYTPGTGTGTGTGTGPGNGNEGYSYPQQQRIQQEAEEPAPPPQPFRVDTSGLSTAHLPPPPTRKDGADGRPVGTVAPSPASRTVSPPSAGLRNSNPPPPTYTKKPAPSLPPRFPPRENSSSSGSGIVTPDKPTAPSGHLNQGAVGRLGDAGVSVSGFGIGGNPPSVPARAPTWSGGSPAATGHAAPAKKKPPPPPPPKKTFGAPSPQASRGNGGGDGPPPIPLATRPTF